MGWIGKRKPPAWISVESDLVDEDRMREIIQELVDNPKWPGTGEAVISGYIRVPSATIPKGSIIKSATITLPQALVVADDACERCFGDGVTCDCAIYADCGGSYRCPECGGTGKKGDGGT